MIKDYKNPNLEKYFNKYITIDDKFKPYIVDILLRRAYQFQLSPEEIKTDVEAILVSLKEIRVVNHEELGSKWAAATYNSGERSIKIGESTVNLSEELLYQVLTHEVYHALSRDPATMKDKLGGFNQFSGQYNSSLLETIVEKASFKTVFETKSNNLYYNNNSNGYRDMTFILDAIEAVYGVNEQALLRNAIQGRDKMAEFLGSTIEENKEDTLEFLDKLEMHFARLHGVLYPSHNDEELYPDEKLQEIQRSLSDIKKVCEEKMADRIEQFSMENLNELDSVLFDFNKLNAIFLDRSKYFSKFLKEKDGFFFANIQEFMEKDTPLQSETKKTFNRIKQLSLVKKNMPSMDPELAKKLFRWAKYGNLENYNQYILLSGNPNPVFLEDVGIDLKEDNDRDLDNFNIDPDELEAITQQKTDSKNFTAPWDNSIAKSLTIDLKREKRKNKVKRILNKVGNVFRTKNKNQLYLPSGDEQQIDDSKNAFIKSIAVSTEQLKEGQINRAGYSSLSKTVYKEPEDIEFGD